MDPIEYIRSSWEAVAAQAQAQGDNLWQDDQEWDQAARQATAINDDDNLWSDDEAWDQAARLATSDVVDEFDDDPEFNVNGKRLYDRREKVYVKRIQRGGSIPSNNETPQIEFQFLHEKPPRNMNTFYCQVYNKTYRAIHNFDKMDILAMGDVIDAKFRTFLDEPLSLANDTDQVSVTISNGHLRTPIFVSFKKMNFDVKEFANKMAELVQSENGKDFILEEAFEVEVAITKRIEGYGNGRFHLKNRAPRAPSEKSKAKRCVTTINNRDNACGYWAVALVLFKTTNPTPQEWNVNRLNRANRLEHLARKLCQDTGLDYNKPMGVEEMQIIDAFIKPNHQLICIDAANTKNVIFKGSPARDYLFIEFIDNHYNAITGNITGYFECDSFCVPCWKPYDRRNPHRCDGGCDRCHTNPPCQTTQESIECINCHRFFYSESCFSNHRGEVCNNIHRCPVCFVDYIARNPHACDQTYCGSCHEFFPTRHHCYITKISEKEIAKWDSKKKLIVSFDIESMLIKNGNVHDHVPNLLIALVCCDDCYDDQSNQKAVEDCNTCGVGEYVFRGTNCVKDFGDFLFLDYARHAEEKKAQILVFAHNLKGYDGHFVMKDLFNRPYEIEPIQNGSKIMMMEVGNVKFIDSLNLFQMPLANLPKSFGFEQIVLKGYFPHEFNLPENQDYCGQLPDASYFGTNLMTPDAKAKFQRWHDQEKAKDESWSFQDKIYQYCYNDTLILMLAIMKFRILFKQITDIDPLSRRFTLASIGLETYRAKFINESKLAITPVTGYSDNRTSMIGDSWLDWIENNLGYTLMREKKIGDYFCDAFDPATNTVYEYNGCNWHGCLKCFPDRSIILRKSERFDISASDLYNRFVKKMNYYTHRRFNIVSVWDCEFRQQMSINSDLANFIKLRLDYYGRIRHDGHADIRESFFGGRTNNVRFYYDCSDNPSERIEYKDVTSEYPYVLKNRVYPVGHPVVLRDNFDILRLQSTHPDPYFGFVKCTVLPPERLYLPVLPMTIGGKLLFVLCRTCGLACGPDPNLHALPCNHSDHERQLTGTWTTCELAKAIEKGYRVTEIMEILHYHERSGALFASYINMWLKVKQEASGWPKSDMTEAEKDQYIKEYYDHEGIALDRDNIMKNPGRRSLAKLMLNSFWGKLSQRPNMPKTKVIKRYDEYRKIIDDPKVKILGESRPNDQTIILNHELINIEDAEPGNTNIAIASFVTSYARLHLYRFMDEIVTIGQDRLLYYDTDSVIFIRKPHDPEIKTGNFLGDLTDELADYGPNARCIKFVSGGPKNYGYEVAVQDQQTGEVKTKCTIKTKGIRHTAVSLQLLTIAEMTKMAKEYCETLKSREHQIKQIQFKAGKFNHHVQTLFPDKVYRMVSLKRRIIGNATLPYGYKE